jgi:hypothetical protein
VWRCLPGGAEKVIIWVKWVPIRVPSDQLHFHDEVKDYSLHDNSAHSI